MSLTAEGRALLEQERASNQAAIAADKFLASLKNQTDAIGKTKTELLEMKAAQLSVLPYYEYAGVVPYHLIKVIFLLYS